VRPSRTISEALQSSPPFESTTSNAASDAYAVPHGSTLASDNHSMRAVRSAPSPRGWGRVHAPPSTKSGNVWPRGPPWSVKHRSSLKSAGRRSASSALGQPRPAPQQKRQRQSLPRACKNDAPVERMRQRAELPSETGDLGNKKEAHGVPQKVGFARARSKLGYCSRSRAAELIPRGPREMRMVCGPPRRAGPPVSLLMGNNHAYQEHSDGLTRHSLAELPKSSRAQTNLVGL